MNVTMKYRISTKGTHVFNEVMEDGRKPEVQDTKIPSLYIRRTAFPDGHPQYISVTVETIK